MTTQDIRKELKSKERSLVDLHRYITTRVDNNPNYVLLLGAGCSVSSGISTGQELINVWRKEIFYEFDENREVEYNKDEAIKYLSSKCGSWYNSTSEYSSLFEKKYDLPRQRRMFVEKHVSGAQPSLGYAYLTGLIDDPYFNTIFTTNFDDLINESFYQFTDLRPIVCAHDSSISSITVTSKRPKIIKLHGDYLFDDIKSTLRETESLEENIKNKFIEFSKDYGIIVVGYSGSDRSIMDVINYLLKQEDYLKNGIYWCLREGDEVTEELRKLLWKDRVYYVLIDGFDEFFAYNYNKIKGNKVPIDTGFISSKSQDIVKGMLENTNLNMSKSPVIKSHLGELKKFSKRHGLQTILGGVTKKDYLGVEDNEYTDEELLKIFKIKEKLNRELYVEAIDQCNEYISESFQVNFKIELYKHLIMAYDGIGDKKSILNTYDKIIEIDPESPVNFLNKSKYDKKFESKLNLIDLAIEKDPYFYGSYYEKAELLAKKYYIQFCDTLYSQIIDLYDTGIQRYPNLYNLCYAGKFDFIIRSRIDKDKKHEIVNAIIRELEKQRPDSYKVLRMKLKLRIFEEKKIDEEFLELIMSAKNKYKEKNSIHYDCLTLEALAENGNKIKIEDFIRKLDASEKYAKSIDYLKLKAKILAENLCDIDSAIKELEKLLNIEKDIDSINTLLEYSLYVEKFDYFDKVIKKYKKFLDTTDLLNHQKNLLEFKEDYKGAYMKYLDIIKESLFPDNHKDQLSYYLIKMGDYEEAKRITKEYLDEVNFSKKAEVAIINYELSLLLIDEKRHANKKSLIEVYESTSQESTKAAIQALLKDKDGAFRHIKQSIEDNYTMTFFLKRWPVFMFLHDDPRWGQFFD